MFFKVDASNGIPIYEQIVRQIKFAVAEGALTPGQSVPSVRELARQLAINPNTIQRAFLELQNDGVLEPSRGRASLVKAGAVEICRRQRQAILASRMAAVVEEGLQSGLMPEEVRELFDRTLAGNGSQRKKDRS